MSSPEGYLLALWVHECRRVFADKLVNYDDKGWVDKAISDLCSQEFPPELCKQVGGHWVQSAEVKYLLLSQQCPQIDSCCQATKLCCTQMWRAAAVAGLDLRLACI